MEKKKTIAQWVIDNEAHLKKLCREDLYNFFKKHYGVNGKNTNTFKKELLTIGIVYDEIPPRAKQTEVQPIQPKNEN